MSYDRDLRLRLLEYVKAGHSFIPTASVFKVNISTIIAWKRRYEATGDVKTKPRCPINKKTIPEKHALLPNTAARTLIITTKVKELASAKAD